MFHLFSCQQMLIRQENRCGFIFLSFGLQFFRLHFVFLHLWACGAWVLWCPYGSQKTTQESGSSFHDVGPKPEVIRHCITHWAIPPVLNIFNSYFIFIGWNNCISIGHNVLLWYVMCIHYVLFLPWTHFFSFQEEHNLLAFMGVLLTSFK